MRKVGLQINVNKTKLTELINNEENPEESEWIIYKNLDDFN